MVAGGGTTMTVQDGGSATFIAGKKINFFDGTSANHGGYLHGFITTSGQYCTTPAAPQVESVNESGKVQVNSASPSFRVYPNPTTGNFMVALSDKTAPGNILIEVFGMQGDKLITKELSGTAAHEFELSGRPAGIYYVRLISGNQTETVKIIKQ